LKFLVVGLGNPGREYTHTRHNIGFDVLDVLAQKSEVAFAVDRYADVARIKLRGKPVVLVKPSTFMNLSGKAVNYWMQSEHIPVENILIITDDIALPSGTIRIRLKGSDGGHNGLRSINETLNTTNYARLRFGVGNDFPKGQQADYVLSKWPEDQHKMISEKMETAVEAIRTFIAIGPVMAMNRFNTPDAPLAG
jgi:peptidyl-tRNA hydrolase, PTH1 family